MADETRDVRWVYRFSTGIVFSFLLIAARSLPSIGRRHRRLGHPVPTAGVSGRHDDCCLVRGLFFEIVLPSALSDVAGSAGNGHSLGGHFLTGALTLLAAPCSAPFLGTAVGFALSRGPVEIFGIFFVLGLGLSLPYLCVAAAPQLATRLPRPGNWMTWLRYILGLALAATGVWLITVLTAQIGAEAAINVGALVVLMVAVIALKQMSASRIARHASKVPLFGRCGPSGRRHCAAGRDQVPHRPPGALSIKANCNGSLHRAKLSSLM